MKRKLILFLSISLLFSLLLFSCNPPTDLTGTWKGGYRAAQGETGLTLSVYNTGEHYETIINFYNLPEKKLPKKVNIACMVHIMKQQKNTSLLVMNG